MEFATAPPLETSASWQWPARVDGLDAQRIADVGLILTLERAPPAVWQAFQTKSLQRLLAFVVQASPAWRDRLRRNGPVSRQTQLPILERAEFRRLVESHGALPLPAAHGDALPHSTSGSTGMPVRFFVSQHSLRVVRNHFHADHPRHGRDLMRTRAALGSRTDPHPGMEHVFARGNPWLGESHLYTRRNTDFSMAEHAQWLARLAPAWLAVNPTVLSGMLEAYEAGDANPPSGLEQVITFGGTIEARLRQRTRQVLGASIRDRYSCEEIGPVAWQCPNDTGDDPPYHVAVTNTIVETVDDAGQALPQGETGRVLVTGLHHWASPAIRYDLGDVAALHPRCPACGAGLPTLTQLLGRRRGLLRTPSGRGLFVRLTASDWLDVAPVREFRLVQQAHDRIRVELVLAMPLSDAMREAVAAMLSQRVSPEFSWEIVALERIAWPPGEKRQDIVCEFG